MALHYIFDFDGVLSDSMVVACEEINRLRAERFPQLPHVSNQWDLAMLYCGPLKTSLKRFGLSGDESKAFFDLHSRAMERRADEIRPFDCVVEFAAKHLSGRCTIVTSSYSSAVRTVLNKSPWFSEDIFSDILGRELALPKADKFEMVLDSVGVRRKDVLHLGDTVSDLLYSKEVHLPFCAAGWGYHPLKYLSAFGPDYEASSPDQLSDVIDRLDFERRLRT
jgi:phosphoglycolate phosphatase-like HAD superfamily hydrolase